MSELIRVENLTKRFAVQQGVLSRLAPKFVSAVEDVSFSVNSGETREVDDGPLRHPAHRAHERQDRL